MMSLLLFLFLINYKKLESYLNFKAMYQYMVTRKNLYQLYVEEVKMINMYVLGKVVYLIIYI